MRLNAHVQHVAQSGWISMQRMNCRAKFKSPSQLAMERYIRLLTARIAITTRNKAIVPNKNMVSLSYIHEYSHDNDLKT